MCATSITVKAATARLAGMSPSELAGSLNLCAVDSVSLNRNLQRRTRSAVIDDSMRSSIVATCVSRKNDLAASISRAGEIRGPEEIVS